MKNSSIRYLVKEGIRNIFNNKLMSLASIGVLLACLLITGFAALFSINVKGALTEINKQNTFTVYLKNDIDNFDRNKVSNQIMNIDNISSLEFFSKEEAIQKYQEVLGELFEGLQGDENPMPDAYHVTMIDLSKYDETVNYLLDIDEVESVADRSDSAKSLANLDKMVTFVGMWIIIILSVVSLFIMSNTISVTMYSRRLEISIMKSVGATDSFIRIPFLVEGITIGLVSAIFSLAILWGLYETFMKLINQIITFPYMNFMSIIVPLSLCFLGSGILFGFIGGMISIRKYLKKGGGNIIGL